ncbi:hypothetical protein ACO0LB_06180 [Undibacterium sp. SXout7W]|uniref:hypothetical protein n=1 Tax=Undibacterium sp. SXout7W TaxID=3413049 RepID=UPI003BF30BEC
MHINIGSETEPTKLQIQAEGERTDVTVTAPLAIHNTICSKKIETDCAQCQARAQKQSGLKKNAIGFVMFASLAFCAVMAATVLPASTKRQEEDKTQEHCYNDGNQYSVGSIEKMKNDEYRECVRFSENEVSWGAIRRDKSR